MKNLTLTRRQALKSLKKGQSIEFIELIDYGSRCLSINSIDNFAKYKEQYKGHTVMAFESFGNFQKLKDCGNGTFTTHRLKL